MVNRKVKQGLPKKESPSLEPIPEYDTGFWLVTTVSEDQTHSYALMNKSSSAFAIKGTEDFVYFRFQFKLRDLKRVGYTGQA